MKKFLVVLLAVCALSTAVQAAPPITTTPVTPIQTNPMNVSITAVANPVGAPVTVTFPGVSGQRVHIYRVTAFCGASPFPVPQIFIVDGAAVVFEALGYINSTVSAGLADYSWPTGLTGGVGNTVQVQAFSCGTDLETVSVQADQF